MRKFIPLLLACLLSAPVYAEVRGKEVSYSADGITMKGYLAYDDKFKGKRPSVLVVHEWWGHNEYARKRARMLAEMGYTALAVDMYGDGKQASHPDDAGKFATAVHANMSGARARFEAGMNLLKKNKTVDAKKMAAIGYCFGGGVVLEMARMGEPLAAVASFHGHLGTDMPATAGKIKARVAVFTGAADPMAPADQVDAFKKEMDAAKVDYKLVSYPNVKHSFTNPDADEYGKKFNLPLAYDAEADKDSWKQTEAFLAEAFGKKK
jgi:dienelactone hydrolase